MWSETFTGELPQEKHDLVELVKQVRNRCEVYLANHENPAMTEYLWTILEDMAEDSQEIWLDHCAKHFE